MNKRRLKGRDLVAELIKVGANNDASQYSDFNINPYVYSQVQMATSKKEQVSKKLIIEFGARGGYLGKKLVSSNAQLAYIGVEPKPPHDSYNICHDTCENFINNPYGCSLANKASIFIYADVLEHLVDPWSHLAQLHKVSRTGALIIASIPNFFHHSSLSLLSNGRFDYEEWGVLDMTHLRFFGISNMIEMFEISGWHVDNSSIMPAFDPEGIELYESFKAGRLESWSKNSLCKSIKCEADAISLAAYQFVFTANYTSY